MKTMKHILLLISLGLMLVSCQSLDKTEVNFYLEKAKSYKAKITRDIWGVPHVFGETDADAAHSAKMPFILVKDGYTEKTTDQIHHEPTGPSSRT